MILYPRISKSKQVYNEYEDVISSIMNFTLDI